MVVISIVLVFLIFTILNPTFISAYSLQNLLVEVSPLILLAGGLSFIIFTGGIDLGAGAMVSATCVISGLYVSRFGNWIIPIMVVIGVGLGLLNGVIVTKIEDTVLYRNSLYSELMGIYCFVIFVPMVLWQ